MNNIYVRRDYKECYNNKKFVDLSYAKSKYSKLDYIDLDEPFSKPTNSLINKIRNAIQHFNCDIDYDTQIITFTDQYNGKTRTEEVYLIDFANMCLDNFSFIFYILEIVYNFRKIKMISSGEAKQSDFLKSLINPTSKVKYQRNSPCPCGSGRKYKHCCGK